MVLAAISPARAFEVADRVDLPLGIAVEYDGGRALRVVRGSDTLLRAEFALVDAEGTPAAAAPGTVSARLLHWNYYHVDDIVFVDAEAVADSGRIPGATALVVDSPAPWTDTFEEVRPSLGAGRSKPVGVRLTWTRTEDPDGERLYLGILRLDRAGQTREGSALIWDEASGRWPLAVLSARTEKSLRYLAGQALWTYDRVGEGEVHWRVPPLNARCQHPELESAEVSLREDGDFIRLEIRVAGEIPREHISGEGLRVRGHPLARYYRGRHDDVERYLLPRGDARTTEILRAAASGALDLELWTDANLPCRPGSVAVEMDETLRPLHDGASAHPAAADLPSHLSPSLVSTWPNPFRDQTTIEVRVPATLGEAFDFEPEQASRLKLESAPPFGAQPTVRVRVYNVSGQLVQVLDESARPVGRFSLDWDGRDLQGRPVSAGAYYVNVEMDEWSVTRRILRLKD